MNTMFYVHLHCGEQMGRPHHHCKAVGRIRAVTQYIKMPPLWSYHTCHLSISSYICQAIRILIAQLIKGSHDWWNRRIYGRSKCWARVRQMCDSIADYYGRIIGCSVKCQPLWPTLNSSAWRRALSLPSGCNSGNLEPQVKNLFRGKTTPFVSVSAPLACWHARSGLFDSLYGEAPSSSFFQLQVIVAVVAQLFPADDIWGLAFVFAHSWAFVGRRC